jgi:hypothetical protein
MMISFSTRLIRSACEDDLVTDAVRKCVTAIATLVTANALQESQSCGVEQVQSPVGYRHIGIQAKVSHERRSNAMMA